MKEPVVCARGLGFEVNGKVLLEDVNLAAAAGELVALVGPNGAGKSSLQRLLSGELKPTWGSCELFGKPVASYRAAELALKRAVLPQQTVLQFAFSAREVVLMGRSPHLGSSGPSKDDYEIADESLVRTESQPLATRVFPSLSGGEQSRVTLSRVLAQRTPVLFLDEPTASLDLRHQEQAMKVARTLALDGACVIVVLHDLNLAAAYADRIALLSRGRLVAVGTPVEVLTEQQLSRVFECDLRVLRDLDGMNHPVVMPNRGRLQAGR